MGRKNTSNPHDADPDVFHKETNMSVQKARVVAVSGMPNEDGFHTVRIRVYADESTYLAPVVTPMPGCIWVPKEDTDVAVIFSESDKPWVIGSWYAVDRVEDGVVDLPDYQPGDIRLGNESGSHVTVYESGAIDVKTDGRQPVDIDHQSGTVYLSSDEPIAGDDAYHIVGFDTADDDDDPEGLFDASQNAYIIRESGQHRLETTVEIPSAGQGNAYTLAIFRNGTEFKRRSRQSSVNEPLSLAVDTQRYIEAGDVLDVRLKQDSGTDRTVTSDTAATEFNITRKGI